MSQEDVELMRAAYAEFQRTGELNLDLLDPDIDFRQGGLIALGLGSSGRGPGSVAQGLAEFRENFQNHRSSLGSSSTPGGERRGGRPRGVEVDAHTGWIIALRDRMIVEARGYFDRADAIHALGVAE